jgi:hypothetical protein
MQGKEEDEEASSTHAATQHSRAIEAGSMDSGVVRRLLDRYMSTRVHHLQAPTSQPENSRLA